MNGIVYPSSCILVYCYLKILNGIVSFLWNGIGLISRDISKTRNIANCCVLCRWSVNEQSICEFNEVMQREFAERWNKRKMGILFTRMFSSLFGDREARILVLGLDNAGKTTILCNSLILLAFCLSFLRGICLGFFFSLQFYINDYYYFQFQIGFKWAR